MNICIYFVYVKMKYEMPEEDRLKLNKLLLGLYEEERDIRDNIEMFEKMLK